MTAGFGTTQADDTEQPLYCYNHPNVPTYLRCGKCERPICARCRVSTPVGFRCYECANVQVLPTYAIDANVYLKGAAAGLTAGGIAGILMGFFPGFEFWAALLMGVAVPEAVAWSSNQKRGPGLQWLAIGCVLFGFIVSRVVLHQWPGLLPLGGINFPARSDIGFLRSLPFDVSQYTVLWFALSSFLAYKRLQ
jgi:hypothetical protein